MKYFSRGRTAFHLELMALIKNMVLKISSTNFANLRELIDFYSPWNHKKPKVSGVIGVN